MERLQIDEQLRQIGVGYRAPASRSGGPGGEREKGYLTDESSNSLHTSRTYGGRGRGRRASNSQYSGYGKRCNCIEMYCHCAYDYRLLHELPLLDAGTNSELSNASESEEVNDREQRPRGIGGDERGSRRGGRGRGTNSGRGRGGPGSKPSNSISSGNQSPTSGYTLTPSKLMVICCLSKCHSFSEFWELTPSSPCSSGVVEWVQNYRVTHSFSNSHVPQGFLWIRMHFIGHMSWKQWRHLKSSHIKSASKEGSTQTSHRVLKIYTHACFIQS